MYNVISMTSPAIEPGEFYTEAVFNNGKKSLDPILEKIKVCRDILLDEIKKVDESHKINSGDKKATRQAFDPKLYWKNKAWKELEDTIIKVFGFRYCEINPFIEKYNAEVNDFETRELNCMVYHADRYPIEGLVTDKGYYDNTHSSTLMIYITLGLIKDLEPDEIVGVLLHEFGHSIDPALTTISYLETNVLSKYLTDRTGSLSTAEKRAMKKSGSETKSAKVNIARFALPMIIGTLTSPANFIFDKIFGKDHKEKGQLEKIKKIVENDKKEFTRQEYSEAFADNFARMYGYGSALVRGLHKLSAHTEKRINESSWLKKDRRRREYITAMTIDALKDVHKTDIHRIRALIKEYKEDINDPKTPPEVKKYMESDMKELEAVLNEYMNNFSEFQNKVNQTINAVLEEKEK